MRNILEWLKNGGDLFGDPPADEDILCPEFIVRYVTQETIDLLASSLGKGKSRSLLVRGGNWPEIYVRKGDTLAIGHEVEHLIGSRKSGS